MGAGQESGCLELRSTEPWSRDSAVRPRGSALRSGQPPSRPPPCGDSALGSVWTPAPWPSPSQGLVVLNTDSPREERALASPPLGAAPVTSAPPPPAPGAPGSQGILTPEPGAAQEAATETRAEMPDGLVNRLPRGQGRRRE